MIERYLEAENWQQLERKAINSLTEVLANSDIRQSFGLSIEDVKKLKYWCFSKKIYIDSPPFPSPSLALNISAHTGSKEDAFFDPIIQYEYVVDQELEFVDEFIE